MELYFNTRFGASFSTLEAPRNIISRMIYANTSRPDLSALLQRNQAYIYISPLPNRANYFVIWVGGRNKPKPKQPLHNQIFKLTPSLRIESHLLTALEASNLH